MRKFREICVICVRPKTLRETARDPSSASLPQDDRGAVFVFVIVFVIFIVLINYLWSFVFNFVVLFCQLNLN